MSISSLWRSVTRGAFPDRAGALAELNEAYKAYSKDRGQLDDPEDLKRKLRGSGVNPWC